jgi:hypothetical protein
VTFCHDLPENEKATIPLTCLPAVNILLAGSIRFLQKQFNPEEFLLKAMSPRKKLFHHWGKALALLAVILLVSSCAYRHYLGIHGSSIKKFPDIHTGITADKSCLMCHTPGAAVRAPATSHPQFKGCLKCHNDDLTSRLENSDSAPTGQGEDRMSVEPKT